ncbi:MAG: chorismate lyase, partial [Betaproteobacteria bacterium]|nr:chorismate lyase [Betaproteobacteria bacterium]
MLNRPHAGWRTTPPDAPAGLAPWLTDRDSLTAALRSRCRQLRVECRWQGLAPVLRDESALLGVSPRGRVWVREVALVADGVPWVPSDTLFQSTPGINTGRIASRPSW